MMVITMVNDKEGLTEGKVMEKKFHHINLKMDTIEQAEVGIKGND